MRTEHTTEREEDRLSSEELHALRARLFGETSGPKKVSTVADLAEALGRSPEDVWRQLDRLRAEQAFGGTPKAAPRSQKPLLVLALILFGSAYGIYQITPRPVTEEDIERRLEEARQIRANRPKKIRYPIETKVPFSGKVFAAFSITAKGLLTKTTLRPPGNPGPVTVEEAYKAAEEALRATYEAAVKAEAEAPPPPTPLKVPDNPWNQPTADQFVFEMGAPGFSNVYQLPTNPAVGRGQIPGLAKGFVDTLAKQQEDQLKPGDRRYTLPAPPGFSVSVQGGASSYAGFGRGSLALRPIDPVAVRARLEECIRDSIRRSSERPTPMPGMPLSRKSPEAALTLTISAPLGTIEKALPMRAGGEFPTAADALRTYEKRIQEALDEAVRQVREVNAGKWKEE